MGDEFEAFIESQKAQLAQERRELLKEPNVRQERKKWETPTDSWNKNEDPTSQNFMPQSDIEERRKLLQKERKMEYQEMLTKMNGFKENLPPKPPTPDVGLVSKLGGYSEKRQRLQEERKREYNRMLAEQKMRQGGKQSSHEAPTSQPTFQGNRERDSEEKEQWMDDRPGPPRKGWATPTYEEILERKRKQERNYRRMEDPYDGSGNLGGPSYNRTSVSEDNLMRQLQEENEKFAMLDQQFERKKVRFLQDRRPSSNPEEQYSDSYDNFPNQFHQGSNPQRNMLPPSGQSSRKTGGSEPENFSGTLLVGQEMRASQDKRKKGNYRQELQQQMEEAKARKLQEKMESQKGQSGFMDTISPGRPEPSQSYGHATSVPPANQQTPLSNVYGTQPRMPSEDMGLGRGFYDDRLNTGNTGGILGNGFEFNSAAIPGNRAGLIPSLNPYSSPLNDAYFYYGTQNPLDPNFALGAPTVPTFMPPHQVGAYSLPPFPAPVQDLPNPMLSLLPQQKTSAPTPGATQNFALSGAQQHGRDTGGLLGEDLGQRRRAEDEKKRMYNMELQRQMEEDKLKKQKQKAEQEKYDRKIEAEIANYSPFGQPGAGAPMRDRFGNVIVARKPEVVVQANAQTTPRAADYPMAPLTDQDPYGASSNTFLSLYKSPFLDADRPKFLHVEDTPDSKSSRAEDELRFARGGNGIFGEPMTSEQKNVKQKYQDELRRQIEEKKKKEQEEKERLQKEEELLIKRIEEDNLRVQKEQEEEKRRQREKAEEAERQQQDFKRQQEEQRKEAEKRKKEADEARQRELKQQEEEKRKAEQNSRTKSPPLPAAAAKANQSKTSQSNSGGNTYRKHSQPRNPSPDPADGAKSRQSRMESARALGHLARMKEKLNSERKRVESDLKKEKMSPEVFDPRLMIRRPSLRHDTGAFDTTKQNRTAKPQNEYPRNIDDLERTKDRNLKNNRRTAVSPGHDDLEVEDWQRSVIIHQNEELRQLRRQRTGGEHNISDDGPVSRPESNLLEAETKFIGIPGSGIDSRQDQHSAIPDELSDLPRLKSASNRRHRRVTISVEADSPARFTRPDSVTSLDPEELRRKNEERMKKLKSLEGDDISSSQADDVLKQFMANRKLSRPPSSNTLMDDSWMRPGSGH